MQPNIVPFPVQFRSLTKWVEYLKMKVFQSFLITNRIFISNSHNFNLPSPTCDIFNVIKKKNLVIQRLNDEHVDTVSDILEAIDEVIDAEANLSEVMNLKDCYKPNVSDTVNNINWDKIEVSLSEVCKSCNYTLNFAEILAGFNEITTSYTSQCIYCNKFNFVPSLKFMIPIQIDELSSVYHLHCPLLSPIVLSEELKSVIIKPIDIIFDSDFLFKSCWLCVDYRTIFWNCILWFNVFNLPVDVLFTSPTPSSSIIIFLRD